MLRPRLLKQLNDALHRPLGVVVAPAGFGKTTLVSTWAASVITDSTASVAWLTLDSYDNSPSDFWTAVVAALQTVDPNLGRELLPLLNTMTVSSPEYLLTPLINELTTQVESPLVLVLDEYQEITDADIHDELTFLIDGLPPHIHLILISRSEVPLPLARLRARAHLTELRAADLRFTEKEAADFLNNLMGLQLSPEMITTLETRTEGWAAGLHLAALSIQHRPDRAEFVRSVTGSHHYILDYLVEEVLQRQPVPIRTFLLQTSILNRFEASLCDAVTGGGEAVTTLELVKRLNLFLVPLDDEQRLYRYHPLFGEMLHMRLVHEQPETIPELHRRASNWYAQHAAGETAMQGEAIRHAIVAGDDGRAVQLIIEIAETLWIRNELTTLRNWLLLLPKAVLQRHPRPAIMLAQVLVINGAFTEVSSLLDTATTALAQCDLSAEEKAMMHGRIAATRSHVARLAGIYGEAISLAQEALHLLPDSAPISRSLAAFGLAMAHHMKGNLTIADVRYQDAVALCQTVGERFFEITSRCLHGRLLIDRGDLLGAEKAFQQALKRSMLNEQRLPIAGWALIGLGTVAYARHNLQEAESLLLEGFDLVRRGAVRNAIYDGYAGLIRLRLAQNDFDRARNAAAQLIEDVQASQILQFIHWAEALRALVDLRSGNLSAAVHWAQTAQPRAEALMFTEKMIYGIFVRVLLATEQLEPAMRYIRTQRALIAPYDHVETKIDLYLLDAITLVLKNHLNGARIALDSALAMAAPRGWVQPFLDAGEPIENLLKEHSYNGPLGTFAAKLVAAFSGEKLDFRLAQALYTFEVGLNQVTDESPQLEQTAQQPMHQTELPSEVAPLVEPLSERELEVIQLMAAGLTNQEIADQLTISVPTVKKHGTNIFGKLQVSNRTEAAVRARELGLLR